MKRNLVVLASLLLFAVGCSTMQDPISSNNAAATKDSRAIAGGANGGSGQNQGNGATDITYSISLVSAVYDEANDQTTFTYTVTSNPEGGHAISHWVIGFDETCGDAGILAGSNDPLASWNDSDPTTGVRGIKFDTGYNDGETRTVTLTLNGSWGTDEVLIAVKAGNNFELGSVQGPVCGGGNGGPGETTTYQISGVVFYDLNENGIQDAGEPGIEGVDVTLSTGVVVVSDSNGGYLFVELPAGSYTVTVGEHNNRDHTTPASVDVTLTDADAVVNFGFAGYEISGVVFFDINGDGVQGADETGIEGVEVFGNGGSVFTDGNGGYLFDQLLPGDYEVSVSDVDGLMPTTPTTVPVSITTDDAVVNFGFELNFEYFCGGVADGFTIGFWKTNISKALDGKTKGTQVSASTLESYRASLASFGLSPLNYGSLQDAYNALSANGSDPVLLLTKQLVGSEYNFANGAYINGQQQATWFFLVYGEYVIAHASEFSADEILVAKDWYDAYNNSHGGPFFGPGCN